MDAAIAFAKNMLNSRYEDIAPSVVEVVKYAFLDSLGVIMALAATEGYLIHSIMAAF